MSVGVEIGCVIESIHRMYFNQMGRLLPMGWRFMPTDEELIKYYLLNKVFGRPIPADVIQDVEAKDFYSKHPQYIAMMNPNLEEEWYFFIHNDEYFHGERNTISVVEDGTSYWSSIGVEEKICNCQGDTLAFKLQFQLHVNADKTDWYMDKYRIPITGSDTIQIEMKECVLARLYKGRIITTIF